MPDDDTSPPTGTALPPLEAFLGAPPRQRLEMLRDPAVDAAVQAHFGTDAHAELRALAARRDVAGTLAVQRAPNIVFVPGVMGSLLGSRLGGIWWIDARTRKQINQLRLAPDGVSDVRPEYGVRPVEVDVAYMPFLAAIDEQPDFNYESFAYDWRKSLDASADRLCGLIERVHAGNGGDGVHIVAHSMGGLMARAALRRHGARLWPLIDRIVFVGTPHFGATAFAGYVKNHLWGFELMALLGRYLDRETLRSMRGVMSLLPAPRGVYPSTRPNEAAWAGVGGEDDSGHPCVNFDLYDAAAWKLDLDGPAARELQATLEAVRDFHEGLAADHEGLRQERRSCMAVIAGVGYETLFRLAFQKRLWGAWEHTEKIVARRPGDPHREGDGRVPLASARLANVGETRYVKGVHGELTNLAAVYEDVFRWLRRTPMQLSDTPEGALTGTLSGPAEASALGRLTDVDPVRGDPGYWRSEADPRRLAALAAQLEAGSLPEFNRIKLL